MFMYLILFITGIVMRYRYPLVYRSYRIPGRGNVGMWLVAGAGIIGTISSFLLAMVPPTGFTVGAMHYVMLLLSSFCIITFVPFAIFAVIQFRRRHESSHRELVLVRHASHVPVREVSLDELSKRHKKV
jgi:amino acid transporter